jgi:MFS family permease
METPVEFTDIEIEKETLDNLDTARKWSMFIAIMGFIFLGLMIVIGIIAGTFLSAFNSGETGPGLPESIMLVILFALGVVYFFPVLFLFRFSKHTAHAVQNKDKNELNKAFRNLKLYFIYLGILLIIVISLYILALIATGNSGALTEGMG